MLEVRAMRCVRLSSLLPLVAAGAVSTLCAQVDSARAVDDGPILVGGSISLESEYFELGSDLPAAQARRAPNFYRLRANPTLTVGELTIPIELRLTSRQTNYYTPRSANQSPLQFLQNPMNRVSIAPRWRDVQLTAGSYTPRISELTAGSVQLFGGALDVTSGAYRVSGFAGTSQRAIEPAPAVRGAYARTLGGIAVGRSIGRDRITLGLLYAADDPSSVDMRPVGLTPQSIAVIGAATQVYLDATTLRAELAASRTARVVGDSSSSDGVVDLALIAEARRSWRAWSLGVRARVIGAEFATPGQLFQESDLAEIIATPSARLFDDRLQLSGSLGWRTDNLADTKAASLTRLIGAIDGLWLLDSSWSLGGRLANYGISTSVEEDSLRVSTTTTSLAITPEWTTASPAGRHRASLSVGLDAYVDSNPVTGAARSTTSRLILARWSFRASGSPLALGASIALAGNDLDVGSYAQTTARGSAGYELLEGDLRPTAELAFATRTSGTTSQQRVHVRLAASAALPRGARLDASAAVTLFETGLVATNFSSTESFVRVGVTAPLLAPEEPR
jgi:hypothetical protein